MGRQRWIDGWIVILGVIGLSLCLLAACAAGDPSAADSPAGTAAVATSPPRPQPRWHAVDHPSLGRKGASGAVAALTTTTLDGIPTVLAAGWRRFDSESATSAWLVSSAGDGTWADVALPGGTEPGTSLNGIAAGAADLVVTGNTVTGGRSHPKLWRRVNGAWAQVPVDEEGRDELFLGDTASTADGHVLIISTGLRDRQREVGVMRVGSDGVSRLIALPGADDRTEPNLIATHDDVAVVVGRQVTSTGNVLRTWHSEDAGATWAEAPGGSLGAEGTPSFETLIWVTSGFVGFGTDSAGTTQQWDSADGITWTAQPVIVDGSAVDVRPRHAASDGSSIVLSAIKRTNSTPSLLRRAPDGSWTTDEYRRAIPGSVRTAGGPVAYLGDSVVVTVTESEATSVGRIGPDGTWTFPAYGSAATIVWTPPVYVDAVTASATTWVLGGATGPLAQGDNGWTHRPLNWVGPTGKIIPKAGLPTDLSSIKATAVGPDGLVAVIGGGRTGERGYKEPDAPTTDSNDGWAGVIDAEGVLEPRALFGGDGEQYIGGVATTPGGWYAHGSSSAKLSDPVASPAIWSSSDLVTWTAEPIDSQSGEVYAVCPVGDQVYALGDTVDSLELSHPALWHRDPDGAWRQKPDAAGPPTTRGWLSACSSNGTTAVALGTIDQRPVMYTMEMDGSLQPATISTEMRVGPTVVRSTEHGFIAAGSDTTGVVSMPALWTSQDGRDWVRHTIPAEVVDHESVSVTDLAVTATQAILLVGDGSRSRVWVIDDLPLLFAPG